METPIVIPTHLRPDGSTYRFFKNGGFEPYVIVHVEESIPEDCPDDHVIMQPNIGIAPSRQAATDRFDRFIMPDDDLSFNWHMKSGKEVPPTPDEVFVLVDRYLDVLPYVGMSRSWMSQANPPHYKMPKAIDAFHAINKAHWPSGFEPTWRLRTEEDTDFSFQHLEAGIPPLSITEMTVSTKAGLSFGKIHDDVNTGCNAWRTEDVIREDDETFRSIWGDFISASGSRLAVKLWKSTGADLEPWIQKADGVALL